MAKKITAISIYTNGGWSTPYEIAGATAASISAAVVDGDAGTVKLYSTSGTNADGTMTQKAIGEAISTAIAAIPSTATATSTVAGVTKLYTGTGTNSDGAMSQSATTTAINNVSNSKFGSVTVGSTTINASSTSQGVSLLAGDNITYSANSTNNSVTINAKDTTYGEASTSASGLMTSAQVTALNTATSNITALQNSVSDLEDSIKDYTISRAITIAVSDWSSATTAVAGVNYYTATKTVTNVEDPHPVVVCGASGTLPTTTEKAAYDTLSYVTVDTDANTVRFYAETVPTSTVYVIVKGTE